MQFGIFDQNDHGPYPLSEQYENRLQLIEFYDRAGFRTYHMSEHHSTPLNLTPSPSVFLAAVAQRTKRLRLGALVYVLPAHHPLRLAEEICMLDHLSRGRIEVGIGRGASPHELNYFGVDPDQAQAMYVEAYTVIMQALTQTEVNFRGKHYIFENVPIDMKPAQLPHPPLWYAVPVPEGAVWPAQNKINIVCGGPLPRVREITDRYRAEWAAAGNSPDRSALAWDQSLRDRGRYGSGCDGAWPPRLAGFLHELHEALEETRHPAALCAIAGRFRYDGAEWRSDRGIARHDPRAGEKDDGRGGRQLLHQPVFLRQPDPTGGIAFRRYLRARDASSIAGTRWHGRSRSAGDDHPGYRVEPIGREIWLDYRVLSAGL